MRRPGVHSSRYEADRPGPAAIRISKVPPTSIDGARPRAEHEGSMTDRVCVTRRWKRAQAGRPRPTGARPAAGGPFSGTVYLANLQFVGAGGRAQVSDGDLSTVQAYLGRALPVIADYSRQYGATALALGPPLPLRSVTVSAGGYTDADLQGWVNAIVRDSALGPGTAVLVLNPPGVTNQDAKESGGVGVLGYHGKASVPYSFVNLLGSDFTVDDHADLFAEAVSHEIAEMTVDPAADDSLPEVCDGCGTNCQGHAAFRAYFDAQGGYLGTTTTFPPGFSYAFFIGAIARPSVASDCPAPAAGCAYAPPAGASARGP